jgi:enoyl-[acyl-carrier protein] reductase II
VEKRGLETRITKITGSKYPILLGPMRLISLGEMAAAVSNSGGFGQIGASGLTSDRLRSEIRKARELSGAPIGINIPVYRPNAFEALEIAIEEGIQTITTSAGDPRKLMNRIKETGLKVLHKCSTVDMGKKAEEAGVDGVIASGTEAGGHVSRDEISTLVLVPQMIDALKIPVVAAGGVGDGRGLLAVMVLGAEGVEIGTRFLATKESPIPDFYKEQILSAKSDGTVIIGRKALPMRVLKSKGAEKMREIEEQGAAKEDINAMADRYYSSDNPDHSLMPAGQIAGMIDKVLEVSGVIRSMMDEAKTLSSNVPNFFREERE